jgi:hypothetical protein
MAVGRHTLVIAVAASCFACSTPGPRVVHIPPAEFRGTQSVIWEPRPESDWRGPPAARGKRSSAGLVEEALHSRGIRFGTDGSVPALFAFALGQFERIPAEQARDGDMVFFDTGTGCGGHVGLVETAEASGRIGFREWRNGSSRHSFATPRAPLARRDANGIILNTFLRPKRMDDPADTRYFAGDMLCAAFRVEAR